MKIYQNIHKEQNNISYQITMKAEMKLTKIHFHPDEIHQAVVQDKKDYFLNFTNKALLDLC
jgi:hypothetical protein